MKKITFLLLLFLISVSGSYAQCINTTQYGSAVSANLGLVQTISTASYTGEYSNVTNLLVGSNYIFSCNLGSDGLGAAKYVTITDVSNTVIAYGPSPLTVNTITATAVRAHWSNDATCTTSNTNHLTTVQIVLACPVPTAAVVSNITTTGANFAWTPGGTETAWQVLIQPAADAPPTSTTTGTAVSTNPVYAPTTLTAATAYSFYYRSNCGIEFSPWNGPVNFVTSCVDATAFSQNFDASTSGFPPCWSKVGPGGYAYVQSEATAPSSPNVLYMVSYSVTSQAVVSMPPVNNASAAVATHRLKFQARSAYTWGLGGVIEVGYLTNIADATSFVSIQSFTTTSATVWDTNIAEIGGIAGTNQILAFRHSGNPSNDVYIDNVVWEPIPSCPDISGLASSNVTISTADISWTAGGSETAWQYVIGATTVTDPSTLTPVAVATTPFATIPALSPQTSYKVWVRSNCGVGGFGAWVGPIIITTPCLPTTLPWSENFDTLATGTNIFPACWAYANIASTWSVSTYPTAYSGANSLRRTYSTDGWAFTPTVTLTAGTSYTLSYYMRTDDEIPGYEISVSVGSGQSIGDMSDVLLTNSNYHSVVWTKFSAEYTPTVTGVYSYGLHVSAPYPPNGINFDDFYLSITPSCLEPTELVVSNVTDVVATVSWTAATTIPANGYEYYLSTSSTAPTAATVATGSVAAGILTKNFVGLTANTSYYVWVRSVCSLTASSVWSGVATFKTNCTPVTTFSENFDASTNMPSCWAKVGTQGTAYINQWSSNPPSPANVLYMYGNSATTQPVVSMPAISNAGAGTHRLKFKLLAPYDAGGIVEVGYLTNASDATSFVSLQSFTATSTTTYQDMVAEFGIDPTISQTLAFRHTANPTWEVQIDNVTWDVIPSTAPSCATAITATPNATCGNFATQLSWTAAPGSDGYLLTMGTTAGGNTIFNNENIGSGTTYSFVGNMNTTYYYKIVPFNSFGNATGCTEQSFITNTNGCYCTSLPTSNDNNGITNIVLGTTPFTNGDVTYADKTATPVSLEQNANTNLQVSFGTGYSYLTYVFIDLNNDYNFDTSEQLFNGNSSSDNPTVYDASFLMPATAALGSHRMRLVTYDFATLPYTDAVGNPCYSSFYGVTIDFTANIIASLSTNSFDNAGFAYYPNPVKDVLNLSYVNEITSVVVYNLLGQQVIAKSLNSNQSKIDMSNLTKGTYLVKVTADNQVKTLKVIKE